MRQPNYSYEDINDILLGFEEDLDLFERKIEGVYYWELVRHSIRNRIRKPLIHGNDDKFSYRRLCDPVAGMKNIVYKNPWFSDERKYMFYPNTRRRKLEGEWYDYYLDPIAEAIDEDSVFIEQKERRKPAASTNQKYLFLPDLMADIVELVGYNVNIPKREKEIIGELEEKVSKTFDVDVNITREIEYVLSKRKTRLPFYQSIIRKIKPEVCIMTHGVSSRPSKDITFVEACQNENVPVIDVQYTAIDPGFWHYHYPGNRPRHIKPDYFFIWGDYWKDAVELPYEEEEIYITGFPYFERKRKEYSNINKKEQIIFISNTKSGDQLSKVAAELSMTDINYDIVYKLHGGEFDSWEKDYSELATVAEKGLLDVKDSNESALHQLLAESKIQVGVSSTAIYEGLGFGLHTFIIDSTISFETKKLVKEGYAELVTSSDEIKNRIAEIEDFYNTNSNQIFENNSISKTLEAIDDISQSK